MDWWIQGMSPPPRLQVPGNKTQAVFVLPQPRSEACFFHVSSSFTQATGISNISSTTYSCLHSTCSATIVGLHSTPCSSISMLSRGLLVCYSESFCFMVSKWRLGQPHWLLWVLLLSILLGRSSVSLSINWDTQIFTVSVSVLNFLSFVPSAICLCPRYSLSFLV